MKVLYDHQIFSRQVVGGVSRVFVELIKSYGENKDLNVESYLSALLSNNIYLEEVDDNYHIRKLYPGKNTVFHRRGFRFVNGLITKRDLLKRDFDIFHPTYYDPYFLKELGDKPFVLTVYDMVHEKFPEVISKHDKTSVWKRELVRKADRIIAISENTKKDVVEICNVDPDKIDVVYLASSLNRELVDENCLKDILPEKYFLFVSGRGGYKNFKLLLQALVILHDRGYDDTHIVSVGGGGFSEEEIKYIEDLGIKDFVIQKRLTDEELIVAYRKAVSFVYPTLYEGFGIPVLEAMENSCPVILSKTSSLPEVAGDAGIYFDIDNAKSLSEKMEKILKNSDVRDKFIELGLRQSKKFSWVKTAEQTAKIYEKLV